MHFDLDSHDAYATTEDDPTRLVPNPAKKKAHQQVLAARARYERALAATDAALLDAVSPPQGQAVLITNTDHDRLTADLRAAQTFLDTAQRAHRAVPARLPLGQVNPGQQVLDIQTKLITHAIRIAAFNTATALAPGAHRRHGQQPDQRFMTRSAQPRSERPCGGHQRRDFRLRVDVGGDPGAMPREKVAWTGPRSRGRLSPDAARIRVRPRVAAPTARIRGDGQPCPLQRQLGGDSFGACPLEKLDETLEQPAVLRHREPEPATDPQIVIKGRKQRGHGAPPGEGHGRASTRRAVRSTLA